MTHLVETHTVDADSRLRALLPAALQQTLQLLNYTSFTPIQRHALPPLLEGKDVRAQAKTGSGKTAAFGLALLTRLNLEKIALQGLVLCPTRELADQVAAELRRLASTLPNLKILTIYGGVAIAPRQASLVKHPPHLIVGTPGRILDHFEKGHLDFSQLSMLVLDDGEGFDRHAVLNGRQSERNIGLYGIIERTELAGGRLHIRTGPGRGVAVRAVV